MDYATEQARRIEAGRLFAQGLSQAEVARQLGVSRQSASRWFRLWKANGSEGLRGAGRTGRAPHRVQPVFSRARLGPAEGGPAAQGDGATGCQPEGGGGEGRVRWGSVGPVSGRPVAAELLPHGSVGEEFYRATGSEEPSVVGRGREEESEEGGDSQSSGACLWGDQAYLWLAEGAV